MFPTAYPLFYQLCYFFIIIVHLSYTAHELQRCARWKNMHKTVKHRGLSACPQTGCTVTHHSILWIGLFILHFPQLLCCSAVYSAQDIKPTAGNRNRLKVKMWVVKLTLEYDQGAWKAASGKMSSFTISWGLCYQISLGLIIPDSNVFLPPYLPMKILHTFSNPLTAAPAKSSFLLAIQRTVSRQWPCQGAHVTKLRGTYSSCKDRVSWESSGLES